MNIEEESGKQGEGEIFYNKYYEVKKSHYIMRNKLIISIFLQVVVRRIAAIYVDVIEQKNLFDLRKQLLCSEYQELLSEELEIKLKRISLDCSLSIEDYKDKLKSIVTKDLGFSEDFFDRSIEKEKEKRRKLLENS